MKNVVILTRQESIQFSNQRDTLIQIEALPILLHELIGMRILETRQVVVVLLSGEP